MSRNLRVVTTDEPLPQLLTIKEVCEVLQVSRWTVQRRIHDGTFRSIMIGGTRRIYADSIRLLLDHPDT